MHTSGLFYYTLDNVEPKHRSGLKAIQLFTIVKHTLIKKQAVQLNLLIWTHHMRFWELYPDRSITHEMHYLVHYPDWFNRYVPR